MDGNIIMAKDIDMVSIPSKQLDEERPEKKTKSLTYWERSVDRMGKYSWIAVLNQLIIGLGLLYLAIWLAGPYLTGWFFAVAPILFLSGLFYGWYISRQTEIYLSNSGAAIFSYAGLWKKFLPMVVILFVLRMGMILADRNGIISMAPFMRTLSFFLAGVFTARGATLLLMIYRMKKTGPKDIKIDPPSVNDEGVS
jgi:hypothetical protein